MGVHADRRVLLTHCLSHLTIRWKTMCLLITSRYGSIDAILRLQIIIDDHRCALVGAHGRGRAPDAPLRRAPAAPVPWEPLGGEGQGNCKKRLLQGGPTALATG